MSKRPHILLIMSDQHHPTVLGCAGDKAAHTPALDALAARGTRFSSTYCPFPLCGPSRMAFMTARHPHRARVLDNETQLSSDMPTFAHSFTAAGYRTVLCGRMHFVGQDQRHGFMERPVADVPDSAYIFAGWKLKNVLGDLVDTPGMSRNGILKSGPGANGYVAYDQVVTQRAVELIRDHAVSQADTPLMLTVGYTAPHCPFVCPPEDFDACAAHISVDDLPPVEADAHPRTLGLRKSFGVDPLPDAADRWRVHVAYYGLCRHIDRQVSQLLAALKESGLHDDTIVVYTSDHGEALGEHGLWWKSTFYEASCGIPLIIAGPNLAAGQVCRQPVSLIDVGPTLLDLAHIDPLPDTDGRSLAAACEGQPLPPAPVFAEYVDGNRWGPAQACRMIRSGPWKLNYYASQEPELFNLELDPNELRNRANDPDCQPIRQELTALLLTNWNPQQVLESQQELIRGRKLLAEYVRRAKPAEPDPVWYETPPENWFTAVQPPTATRRER